MEIANKNKKYKSNETMVYSCQYHVIFTTKYRRCVLNDLIANDLKSLILEKQNEYQYEILEMEVMPDHIHLLIDINPLIGIHTIIQRIKGYTANILRKKHLSLKSRLPSLWTRSKFVSTVGEVSLETIKKYIEAQKGK
jgi:putative transposase